MDDRLMALMQDLGNAINESLSDSDRIAEAIGEIKRAGYDVFLVLEATIGFGKHEVYDDEEEDEEKVLTDEMPDPRTHPQKPIPGRSDKPSWTPQDQKFLRALRISTDFPPNDNPPQQ